MKLSVPIERFTSPPEDSLPLLRLYFRSLVTGTLTQRWCPVLYVVALSHVNSFVFSQNAAAQVRTLLSPSHRYAHTVSASGLHTAVGFTLGLGDVSISIQNRDKIWTHLDN